MKNEYPNLHQITMGFLFCFATMYFCETAFSAMTVLKTKHSGCLRLAITSILPRINKVTNRKRQQKSH